jgi:hypothetical protein
VTRLLLALLLVCASTATDEAQPRYIDGVFVHSGQAPIELLAFADGVTSGQLRLSTGSFEDVPAVDRVHRILCSLPLWKPALVWASTRAIFTNEYVERRQLRYAVRQVNIYAMELRVAEVETPELAARLARDLGATDDNPAYLFVRLTNGSVAREYMVQLGSTGK